VGGVGISMSDVTGAASDAASNPYVQAAGGLALGSPVAAGALVAGGGIGGLSDWLADKTKRPNYTGYDINRGAFDDPFLAQNQAANASGIADATGREAGADFLGGQRDLISQLQARANGTGGPSLAERMLNQQTNKNAANQAGAMASGAARAMNPALAARMASSAGAAAQQESAGQGATLRAQEQQQAQGLLGSVLASARGQSQSQQAQNDEMVRFYTSLGYSEEAAQNQAKQALEGLEAQNAQAMAGINAGANANYNQSMAGYLGGGLGGAGAVLQGIAAFRSGGVVPGMDSGRDDKIVAARGGEVVVNPENPEYARARAAVEGGAPSFAARMTGAKGAPVIRKHGTPDTRARARGLAKKIIEHMRIGSMAGAAA
jgi:hypothetical protein